MKRMTLSAILLAVTTLVNAQTKNFIDQPYMEVNGKADTLVTPNEIYIRIILSEKDSKDKISIQQLEEKMVSVLKELGINTEKDLTTYDMMSNFKYYLLKSKDIIKTKAYTLKVTDATKASQVSIGLEENGISNTSIERVAHSDTENLKNMMRTKAILDAKQRAIALTKPLDQSIGAAIHISEMEYGIPEQERLADIGIRGLNSYAANDKEMPKIEFEKIKISAGINVKFVLK